MTPSQGLRNSSAVLSIIVGQLKLDGGSMNVFGGIPGDGKIGIPGKNVDRPN